MARAIGTPGFAFAGSFLQRARVLHQPPAVNHLLRPRTAQPARVFAQAAPNRPPGIMRPLVPSPALQEFVQDTPQTRATVLKVLHDYVKEHNLQDPNNKNMVLCDDKLRSLFGVDTCGLLEISKHITPHLLKPEVVGGKYVEEARIVEEQYIQNQAAMEEKGLRPKKRKPRKHPDTISEYKKAGRNLFKPVLLSDDLSAICRQKKEMTRQDIVKAVWDYIHLNNLRAGKGQPIRCDFLLKKVYNSDYIDVKTVMKGIGAHVTKID